MGFAMMKQTMQSVCLMVVIAAYLAPKLTTAQTVFVMVKYPQTFLVSEIIEVCDINKLGNLVSNDYFRL